MVRLTVFPLAFGGCLICFSWGFVNRKRLFPEVEEIHRLRAIEKQQEVVEFREKFAEGLKKEREKKAEREKKQKVQ